MSLQLNTTEKGLIITGYGKTVEVNLAVIEGGIKNIFTGGWQGSHKLTNVEWPKGATAGVVRCRRGKTLVSMFYDANGRKQRIKTDEIDVPINTYIMCQFEIENTIMLQLEDAFSSKDGADLSSMVNAIIMENMQKSTIENLDFFAKQYLINDAIIYGKNIITFKDGDQSGFNVPDTINDTFKTFKAIATTGIKVIKTYSNLAYGLKETDFFWEVDPTLYLGIRTGALAPGSNLAVEKLEDRKPQGLEGQKLDGYAFYRNGLINQNIIDRDVFNADIPVLFQGIVGAYYTDRSLAFPHTILEPQAIKNPHNTNPVITSKLVLGGGLVYPEFTGLVIKQTTSADGRNLAIAEAYTPSTAFTFANDTASAGKLQTNLPIEPSKNANFDLSKIIVKIDGTNQIGKGTTTRFAVIRAYDLTNAVNNVEATKKAALSTAYITFDGNLPSANVLSKMGSTINSEKIIFSATDPFKTLTIKNLPISSKVLLEVSIITAYEPAEEPDVATQVIRSVLDAYELSVPASA